MPLPYSTPVNDYAMHRYAMAKSQQLKSICEARATAARSAGDGALADAWKQEADTAQTDYDNYRMQAENDARSLTPDQRRAAMDMYDRAKRTITSDVESDVTQIENKFRADPNLGRSEPAGTGTTMIIGDSPRTSYDSRLEDGRGADGRDSEGRGGEGRGGEGRGGEGREGEGRGVDFKRVSADGADINPVVLGGMSSPLVFAATETGEPYKSV